MIFFSMTIPAAYPVGDSVGEYAEFIYPHSNMFSPFLSMSPVNALYGGIGVPAVTVPNSNGQTSVLQSEATAVIPNGVAGYTFN